MIFLKLYEYPDILKYIFDKLFLKFKSVQFSVQRLSMGGEGGLRFQNNCPRGLWMVPIFLK